jgi:PhoPQ-activated pathogenicity-related protein
LEFHNDGTQRYEDDLIAYTWDQYLKAGDENWPAQLPMVKSVVRAMDAVQAFAASEQGGRNTVERFVVAGASKRGWTTWLTAAVDDRVAAIVPIVIDVLNIDRSMRHHAAAYGYWAPAVGDYVRHGITRRLDTPRHAELLKTVDPFAYRRRLDMPKYIVNASGDQYFLPDSAQFYLGDLLGENLLRYVPNTDHSLRDSDALQSVVGFYQAIVQEQPLPQVRWRWDDSGAIHVQPTPQPQAALLWQATNNASRDFRLQTIGAGYRSRPLTPNDQGEYSASADAPDDGWTAYFVELTFATAGDMPLKVSTPVRVVPDRLPHADQDPAEFTIGK